MNLRFQIAARSANRSNSILYERVKHEDFLCLLVCFGKNKKYTTDGVSNSSFVLGGKRNATEKNIMRFSG